jgi:hypothetical protein
MTDPNARLDVLKTTIVRAHAARDVGALRVAITEAWILSRALRREADVDAVFQLLDITVTEDDRGMPTFSALFEQDSDDDEDDASRA